jgi:hypothetical protein
MHILALVSDLHVNSTVGLCPPRVVRDDGGTYTPSPAQRWLARCWSSFWDEVERDAQRLAAPVITVVAGDALDINQHSKTQLIEADNPAIILDAAEAVLERARKLSAHLHMVRGTEAHAGGAGALEEALAQRLGAVETPGGRRSWWHLRMNIDGVALDISHHPQTASWISVYQNSAADRQAWRTWIDYHRMNERPPALVVRGHVHYHAHGRFEETECVYLPPWQLSTAFGYRRGAAAWVEPVGGIIALCDSGTLTWRPVRYHPKRSRAWTP